MSERGSEASSVEQANEQTDERVALYFLVVMNHNAMSISISIMFVLDLSALYREFGCEATDVD